MTLDNTAPTASDVQTANGGGTSGRAESGDTITYTFSERIDLQSMCRAGPDPPPAWWSD